MSDAVVIAIVVIVLALVVLALVMSRVARGGGRTERGRPARRGSAPGARRAGAGPGTRDSVAEDDDGAIPGGLGDHRMGSPAATGESPGHEPSAGAPVSDARARARELQWGEDRDFEWVDTRGTRTRRRFEREPERSIEPRTEKRV